jgi:uncharacterized membrane protein YbhN (UPF0104 family)
VIPRLWPWLRLLAGVGILAALGWKVGAAAFLAGLRQVHLAAVLAALVIGLGTTVCTAFRWRVVAGRLGLRLPIGTAVADYYRALLLNAVLPAGVLGDAHRAVSHGRRAGDVGRGVRAVVLERVAGQLVLCAVGGAVLLTQPSLFAALGRYLLPGPRVPLAAFAALAALTAAVGAARAPRRARFCRRGRGPRPPTDAAIPTGAPGEPLSRPTAGWHALFSPAVVSLSATALLGNLTLFLVAARAAGATAPATRLLPLLVLALLAMSLPLNVGGWGPREAVCAVAFGAAGFGAAQGLTAAVVYGVLALVASLPGAAVLLWRHGLAGRGAVEQGRQVAAERIDEAGQQCPPLVGRGT